MRRTLCFALAWLVLPGCDGGQDNSDVVPADADERIDDRASDDSNLDATPSPDVEADTRQCAVPTCTEPCVFDFRSVAADRDGVSEVRLAAVSAPGWVVAIELVATPGWLRFSDGFVQYLERVTSGDWSVDAERVRIEPGAPIEVPAGESFSVEMRADDPGAADCDSGACGAVRVVFDDCTNGRFELHIPLVR